MATLIQLGAPTSNMNILTQIPQILVWLFAFNAFLEGTHYTQRSDDVIALTTFCGTKATPLGFSIGP